MNIQCDDIALRVLGDLHNIYFFLGRGDRAPDDIVEALFDPDCSLRAISFDAIAGLSCERSAELPESMRAEYWRRRWIQLAKQERCSSFEFADGMLSENAY